MTDQTIPAGLTRDEAQAVREWAEQVLDVEVQDETVVHVARVILAVLPTPPTTTKETPDMPDQTLADKVEKIAAEMRDAMRREDDGYPYAEFLSDMGDYIKDLEALLPTPPRPTLADMTPEERRACQWMLADVENRSVRYVIATPHDAEGDATLVDPYGEIEWMSPERVTPRPDLPRMEWPGTEKPAPPPALPDGFRLADHKDHGRVIVTRPEPDVDGEATIIRPVPTSIDRARIDWCRPDELTYLDSPATKGDSTPTEPGHLAVGTVIESADDPRIDALPLGTILLDRNEEATTKRPRPWGWTGLGNTPAEDEGDEPGPWTVLHIPKESDQ